MKVNSVEDGEGKDGAEQGHKWDHLAKDGTNDSTTTYLTLVSDAISLFSRIQ